MQNSLTNRQIVFMLLLMISIGSAIMVAKTIALAAGHGGWITLLLAALFYGIMAAVIVQTNKMYEGKILIEYSKDVTGKVFSYFIGLFYVLYFILLSVYHCYRFDEMITANFLFKTPSWALMLAGMPFYMFVSYKGVRTAARLAEIVGIVFFTIAIIILVTMLIEGRINYLLPLYIPSEAGKYIPALKETIEIYLGVGVLTVIPITKDNHKPSKIAFLAIIGIGLFFVLDFFGCVAMIGMDEIIYHKYPLIDAMRLVAYPKIEFFQRVDIAYQTIGFMRVFVGKAISCLIIVEFLCKLLPKVKRIILVIITGVLIFTSVLLAWLFNNITDILIMALTIGNIFAVFVIPLFLFFKTKGKRNANKNN